MSILSVANIVMTPVCGFAFSFMRQSSILVLVPFLMALMCLCHLYVGLAPVHVPAWPAMICIGSVYRCFRYLWLDGVLHGTFVHIYPTSLFGTAIWPSVSLVVDEAHSGYDWLVLR